MVDRANEIPWKEQIKQKMDYYLAETKCTCIPKLEEYYKLSLKYIKPDFLNNSNNNKSFNSHT